MDDKNIFINNGEKTHEENKNKAKQNQKPSESLRLESKNSDSFITGEFQSNDDSIKLKMEQYNQNFHKNNYIEKFNKNDTRKTMKQNNVKEKDQEIKGIENKSNELNVFCIDNFKEEIKLIENLKKNNYKNCYKSDIYCDYKTNKNEWKIGFVRSIDDNCANIRDISDGTSIKIKLDDCSRIAYFRKYSKISNKIINNKNIYNLNGLKYILTAIEDYIKDDYFINDNNKDIFEIYYIMHSKMYLGLDSAMKIDKNDFDNEGLEERFKIILNILLFISKYYKYILDNKEDFIKYENNKEIINKSELIDLKIVNKKYAFFSFFDESINIIEKIFANRVDYLDFFRNYENKLEKIVPSVESEKIKPKLNPNIYPIYEEQQANKDNNNINTLVLKKICLKKAYKLQVTFTTNDISVKSTFVCYFIDYFYALNGFKYLFELCDCNESIGVQTLNKIINGINSVSALTDNFQGLFLQEKKNILRLLYNKIEQLDEKTINYLKKEDIIELIYKTLPLVGMKADESKQLEENMYFNYISKVFIFSQKLEQKISSVNILIDILNNIEHNMAQKKYKNKYSNIGIKKMSFQDYCVLIKSNQILKILLNENNLHEEIVKRLQDIIFTMYKNNFGYLNKSDESKIKSDKNMIFDVLFNRLSKAENNNNNNRIYSTFYDFCQILSEEDKLYVFEQIKNFFEESVKKDGIPNKEKILFIINFTVQAIDSKIKNNQKKENKEKKDEKNNTCENKNKIINKDNLDNIDNEEEEEDEDSIIDNEEDDSFSKNDDDSLFNFVIEDKDYYGLNLLINFLFEKEYEKYNISIEQKRDLMNLSIEGIIKIVRICEINEKKKLLKFFFFKGIEYIEKSSNVVQFLILFKELKNSADKNTSSIFTSILQSYSLNYGLLRKIMNDIERYLTLINSFDDAGKNNKCNINKIDDKEDNEKEKIFEGFFNNKLNIKIRIELFLFLLQNEKYNHDIKIFKKLINECQTNSLSNKYLNKLLYSTIDEFEDEYIKYLYDNMIQQDKVNNINDIKYYELCKEIIKRINEIMNTFHFMNENDLAVINCEDETQIKGLYFLYNVCINTNNDTIRNDITDFLSDIFLNIKFDNKDKIENYWKNFSKNIYKQLENLLKNGEKENEKGIQGIISLIKKIERKSNDKGEVIKKVVQILKEIKFNKKEKMKINKESENQRETYKNYSFSGLSGIDGISLTFDVKIEQTDYFYMLRYRLSNFFKLPLNTVTVVIDENVYNNNAMIKDIYKNIELNLFNDFDNIYNILNKLESKLNENNRGNIIPLKLIAKSKQNERLANIKNIIINKQQLIKLLKAKKSSYALDIWLLIKDDDNLNNKEKIRENIKDMLSDNDVKMENTNIYYISYILSNFNAVINDNNNFISNKIFIEKIKNIRIDNNDMKSIGEIYEQNNIIKYLLNIYTKILEKYNDKNIYFFIINKIIDFYYITIKQCITIDLKSLPVEEKINYEQVEKLYIDNINFIHDLIQKNQYLIANLIVILVSTNETSENNKQIKGKFEYLILEFLLKNKYVLLNQKIQEFIKLLIENDFTKKNENNTLKERFIYYLLNFFFADETFHKKLINSIKEIVNDKKVGFFIDKEIFENNIQILYDIINYIIEKYYEFKYKYIFSNYISKILIPSIFNPLIDGISLDLSFHEIILGGNCKLFLNLLSNSNNYEELIIPKVEVQLKQYLFNEIIMNKCHKNIYNEKNLDNYKSISITTSYSFTQAVNLFVFLLVQKLNSNETENEMNFYLQHLTELHCQSFWKNDVSSCWRLSFKDNNNSISPYVGLKNLGCTCYMNSLIQVFFNLIPFRESILKCECKVESKKNTLYQLQKLFFSLKYLKTNYYTPNEFTDNYEEKINVHQQMDVDEFYINIIDKIENRLKGTDNEDLVKYFFLGRQNDLLTFQEGCSHHRTNTNNFYSIQLQVKNKKNIYESLDSLIEGELMDGDNSIFCQKCNQKKPVIKSQNFKSLPRILLFVLKRFEFDYNTMKKVKINDYYDFPFELDMTKYKSDKNDDDKNNEKNKYILKSIVVHMGNCENGHYYSFIKAEHGKWYEFNDTLVKPFDENLLKYEIFGGDEMINMNGEPRKRQKNRNAYLLFYEKKDQSDCEQFNKIKVINSYLGKNKKYDNNLVNINNEENFVDGKNINKNEYGIKSIISNINENMFQYFVSKKLFSNEYQYFILELFLNILNYYYNYNLKEFVKHLCRNLNNRKNEVLREKDDIESNLNLYIKNKKLILFDAKKKGDNLRKDFSSQILLLFQYFIIYFYKIFLRTNEKQYLGCMVDLIKFFVNDKHICADYLIEEFCNNPTIIEYLINCPLYDIKKLIVGILYCAMIKSVTESEYSSIKEKKNNNSVNNKIISNNKTNQKILEEDEKLVRQLKLNDGNILNDMYDNDNPLDYQNIPKNILKMIYNILHIIRDTKYEQMNEYRFLFFTIYRFSLVSEKTREFLIYKCRLFELLCLLLHSNQRQLNYQVNDIIISTYMGPYKVSHNILNENENQKSLYIIEDKGGNYKTENYLYMLFFYLLSYKPPKAQSKNRYKNDEGYSLENEAFIEVLLNNIRTLQDAFCFSNYIIEKSDSKSKVYNVYDALINYFDKIDNNDKINYDYNNYINFVNNSMNEIPNENDPGLNPKYLVIIFKKFITSLSHQESYVKKGVKKLFDLFEKYQNYYSYSIMIIDLLIELFTNALQKYREYFRGDLLIINKWLENHSIPPSKYRIEGIEMYRKKKINYESNISEEEKTKFDEKELVNTQKKIDKIFDILAGKAKKANKYEKDIDLSEFKFIIGDVISYQNIDKERVIEEALDEQLKISVEVNNTKNCTDKKEIWIEIDNPTIEIIRLKENNKK